VTRPSGLRLKSAGLAFPFLFYIQMGLDFPHHKQVRERRNRHAVGVSAGEATERDERPRSERSGDSAVAGDQIAANSAGHSSLKSSSSVTEPLVSLCLRVCDAALRLCVKTPIDRVAWQTTQVCGSICVICVICGLLALCGRAALR